MAKLLQKMVVIVTKSTPKGAPAAAHPADIA